MKKTRKFMSILLLLAICISAFAVNSSAALPEDNTVDPLYTNIGTISLGMTFSNGDGNATGTVTRKASVTRLEGALDVYKYVDGEKVFIGTWTNEVTKGSLAVSADFEAEQGVTYYAIFAVIAESATTIEAETIETSKTYN